MIGSCGMRYDGCYEITVACSKLGNSKLTSLVVVSVRPDSWCTSRGVTGSWPVSGSVMMRM